MMSHMDNLGKPDLITIVSMEIPLDKTTSFAEVIVVKMEILSHIYDVTNLSGVLILATGGGQAKPPASIDDKDRTKDLAYIRLSCTIDANNLEFFFQEALCLSFCLKLTQSSYDSSSDMITSMDTLVKPPHVAVISRLTKK